METWMIVSVLRVLANRDAVNLLHFTGNTVDVRTAMDLHGRLSSTFDLCNVQGSLAGPDQRVRVYTGTSNKDDSVTVVTLFKL
jgi:hypothetical protein